MTHRSVIEVWSDADKGSEKITHSFEAVKANDSVSACLMPPLFNYIVLIVYLSILHLKVIVSLLEVIQMFSK